MAANPLATRSIKSLLPRFALPSITAMLVSALYNIVDQIFIGQGVGKLGNAATNVDFPLVMLAMAVGLLFGIGGAAHFSLSLGRGNAELAKRTVGNAIVMLAVSGIALSVIVKVFLSPVLVAFGATDLVLPNALSYTGITCMALPFLIVGNGLSALIRADGKPTYSMLCMVVGCVINCALDPLFIFVFDMGIAGAAWATLIGQFVSFAMALQYLPRFRQVRLDMDAFRLRAHVLKSIASLGMAASFNQLAMAVVQVAMNKTLTHYGGLSVYGSETALACSGIIAKVNMVFMSVVIGIAQGSQPIVGFNYGAKRYRRVIETYRLAVVSGVALTTVGFVCFQLFPRQIMGLFGEVDMSSFAFAERYCRVFLLMSFVNGIQPITSNFFTSIGKALNGLFLSLTRQILFLLPLVLVLPRLIGIDGVMYAGPLADTAAALLAILLVAREMKRITLLERENPLPV